MVEFTRRGFPEEQAREAVRLYREYYGATGLFENRLIPGTVEFLKELKRMGKRVCLATSKPEEFSVRILEKFGILGYFDFVGAATMDGSRGSNALRCWWASAAVRNSSSTARITSAKHWSRLLTSSAGHKKGLSINLHLRRQRHIRQAQSLADMPLPRI